MHTYSSWSSAQDIHSWKNFPRELCGKRRDLPAAKPKKTRIFFQHIIVAFLRLWRSKEAMDRKKTGQVTGKTWSLRLSAIMKKTGRKLRERVLSELSCKGSFSLSSLPLNTLPSIKSQHQQEKEWRQSQGQQNVSA